MRRQLVRIPLLAALIAGTLLLVQSGFGGGHGNLDRVIWVLGLPGVLLAEWAPAPLAGNDLLLLVVWPAIWNILLWAAIAAAISRAVPSKNERCAGAYLHPDGYIVHAQHRAASGVLLSTPPVLRLPLETSATELGIALRTALGAYEEGVPHPRDWSASAKEFLKATGYRSWRALEGPARSCWIGATAQSIVITPLRNGGSRGDRAGFQPFGAEPIVIASDAGDEQVGDALKDALARSQ